METCTYPGRPKPSHAPQVMTLGQALPHSWVSPRAPRPQSLVCFCQFPSLGDGVGPVSAVRGGACFFIGQIIQSLKPWPAARVAYCHACPPPACGPPPLIHLSTLWLKASQTSVCTRIPASLLRVKSCAHHWRFCARCPVHPLIPVLGDSSGRAREPHLVQPNYG